MRFCSPLRTVFDKTYRDTTYKLINVVCFRFEFISDIIFISFRYLITVQETACLSKTLYHFVFFASRTWFFRCCDSPVPYAELIKMHVHFNQIYLCWYILFECYRYFKWLFNWDFVNCNFWLFCLK